MAQPATVRSAVCGARPIRYEIRYVLSGILLKEDDQYRLDHDFAFPDRAGPIERFALRLTLDPAWQPHVRGASALHRRTAGRQARASCSTFRCATRGTGVPAALDMTRPPRDRQRRVRSCSA